MEKSYEFKASSVELAVKNGLEELGLTEEEVDVEVVQKGGIFSKAIVRITPKNAEEEEVGETVEEAEAEDATDEAVEEETEETEAPEETETRTREPRERRERRRERPVDPLYERKKAMRDQGKEFIKETARRMGYEVGVDGKIQEEEICLCILGDDAKNFIGHRGETLEALQTLADRILNQGNDDRIRVVVDAAFYRERRKKMLTGLAKKLAAQAYKQKREIALEPMNSYERRIIHAALAGSEEATTRSDGEGKYRHVVIVPNVPVMSYGNSTEFRKKGPAKTKSYGYNKRKF